jgi:hypothetical protein
MMERKIIKMMLIGAVVFTSCYYDNEADLYPTTSCQTSNMSYQSNIAPILERNCYVCHSAASNTADITLEGYDKLIGFVTSGRLLGAIRREAGYAPMPQNASMLIECDIAKIEQWIADGAPNN